MRPDSCVPSVGSGADPEPRWLFKLSKLLNQEDALGAPWLRGDWSLPGGMPRNDRRRRLYGYITVSDTTSHTSHHAKKR